MLVELKPPDVSNVVIAAPALVKPRDTRTPPLLPSDRLTESSGSVELDELELAQTQRVNGSDREIGSG